MALAKEPETFFCIDINEHAIGSLGFSLKTDVERISAEIGYWLGEDFWGRGIMSDALKAVTFYAIHTHQLTRIYATPYDWNTASRRVLEKAGYTLEGRMRKSVIKDGIIADKFLYAFVTDDE
jgi:RimJ/RimL family protein N-acetyltransferase